MELELLKKREFGKNRYYPKTKPGAILLQLVNRRSFTDEQVRMMVDVGEIMNFSVKITEPVNEVFAG